MPCSGHCLWHQPLCVRASGRAPTCGHLTGSFPRGGDARPPARLLALGLSVAASSIPEKRQSSPLRSAELLTPEILRDDRGRCQYTSGFQATCYVSTDSDGYMLWCPCAMSGEDRRERLHFPAGDSPPCGPAQLAAVSSPHPRTSSRCQRVLRGLAWEPPLELGLSRPG